MSNTGSDDVTKWRHGINRWGVGSSADGKEIRILGLCAAGTLAAPQRAPLVLSREHALELAAWIVAVSTANAEEFELILHYVRGGS